MAKFIPETEATQPDLDLVEPGCAGSRKMEVHVWMALQPAVILRLVRVEIVEDEEIFHPLPLRRFFHLRDFAAFTRRRTRRPSQRREARGARRRRRLVELPSWLQAPQHVSCGKILGTEAPSARFVVKERGTMRLMGTRLTCCEQRRPLVLR
jgi:hypothetical protein